MHHGRRIALVGPSYPYRGGIAHFVDGLNGAMVARGHSTLIASFSRQYPRFLFPGKSQFEYPPTETDVDSSAIRILDSINPVTWLSTANLIRRQGCEITVLNYWTPYLAPAFGTIARRLRSTQQVVMVVHNAIPHERHPGDTALTRFALRSADKLISLSNEVGRQIREQFHIESTVVPHPLYNNFGEAPDQNEARGIIGVANSSKLLLFFGFVRAYKGLDILIRAMPEILREVPDAYLIVAGEFYDDPDPYLEEAQKLGVEEHIRFENRYIPPHLVPTYFGAADVVVQPYRSATQSGVAQIAFNYQRPVITTDVGGLSEIVENGVTGLVIDTPDERLLARAVIRFFVSEAGPVMASAMGARRGRLSWDALVEEIERA